MTIRRRFELSDPMSRWGMHFVLIAAGGIAFASAGVHFFHGAKAPFLVELLRGLGVLICWAIAMYTRKFRLGLFGGLTVTWVGVTGLMILEGGFLAPNLFWMTIFGPICILAGSRGLGWLLCAMTIVVFLVVGLLGIDGSLPIYSPSSNALRAYSAILCMLVLMFVCFISTKWIKELSLDLDAEFDKRQQEQLQKNQFLIHMHHELRNPLTAINAAVEMLEGSSDARQHAFLTKAIKSTSQHVLSILNDVLEIERLSAQPQTISLEEFSSTDLVTESINMFAVQAIDSGSTLRARFDSSSSSLWTGAPSRVRQVLVNLIANSIKHAPGSDIVLSVSQINTELVLEVSDNGPGMSDKAIAHLYEPYASSLGASGTSGLGLRICQLIVQDHLGGSLSVKSSGSGTIFTVRLPFKPVVLKKQEDWQYVLPIGLDSSQGYPTVVRHAQVNEALRVLFVEDDKMNNQVVTMLLETRMKTVQSAFSSQEALSILNANPFGFDVVMVDQNLGDLSDEDGIELTRKIASQFHLPVVGFTGNYAEDSRLRWDEAGVEEVLLKPSSTEEIFSALSRISARIALG